jgi:hypothetical protein
LEDGTDLGQIWANIVYNKPRRNVRGLPPVSRCWGEEIVISNVKITLIESGDFVDVFKVKSAK